VCAKKKEVNEKRSKNIVGDC